MLADARRGEGWRLPWWMHAVAASLPVGVVAALGDGYGDRAARGTRYAWGALRALDAAAWARTPDRRRAAADALLIVVADQYLTG